MSTALPKELGFFGALTIGVGTMVGAGVFVLPAPAFDTAGPAAAAAFVVGGFIALFTALTISELGTAMPKAGGAYYYIDDALGPLFGSVAGIGNWLGLSAATAFYLIGFGSYAAIFLSIPAVDLTVYTLEPRQVTALVAGSFFVAVNYVGAKETGLLQTVIVAVLVSILVLFVVVGSGQVNTDNLRPFAPPETGGWSAVLPAAGLIFITYLGFAEINTAAEEMKNSDRDLPLAVIGSLLIVVVLYAVIMVVMAGVAGYETVVGFGDIAVARIAEILLGGVGLILLTFAGLLATASSANASILASSRINYAMGRDRIVSERLADTHPRFDTPYRSIRLTAALIFGFILIGDIETLAKAGSVLHLIVYGLMNIALIAYRETDSKDYDPGFEAPLYPYVPVLGAILSFGLIAFMSSTEILLSVAVVAAGIIWYFVYSRGHTTKEGLTEEYIVEHEDEMPESLVTAVHAIEPDLPEYRVIVPLSNPDEQLPVVELACTIAGQRDGVIVPIVVEELPEQTPLITDLDPFDDCEALFDSTIEMAESYDVHLESHTLVSRNAFDAVLRAVDVYNADLVVADWSDDGRWSTSQTQHSLRRVARRLPCDVFVFESSEGFDPSQVLLPTAGGPETEVGSELVRDIRERHDSEVTLLHAASDVDAGKEFLEQWARENGLEDAEKRVITDDAVSAMIEAADDATLVVLGATGESILWRPIRRSIVWDVIDGIDTSFIIVERHHERSLRDHLRDLRR